MQTHISYKTVLKDCILWGWYTGIWAFIALIILFGTTY